MVIELSTFVLAEFHLEREVSNGRVGLSQSYCLSHNFIHFNMSSFARSGTVIGIHEAATTGCVEVVMDEEFIGGTTLQGMCSNFRGKLCVWAHLLKVTPENSRTLVNKLVPKQTGQKGYENIIASVESDSLGGTGGGLISASPTPAQSGESAATSSKANGAPAAASKKSTRPASSGRAGSAARGKQGAWREALGPSEKGVGWKGTGKRGGPMTGLAKWKKLTGVNGSKPTQAPKPAAEKAPASTKKEQQLKAMLGVTPTPPVPSSHQQASATAAADGLKALLGVGAPTTSGNIPLSQVPDPPMPPPPPPEMLSPAPAEPTSAAAKLMAMMQAKQPQQKQSGPVYGAPPQPSGFNFTYVKEGEEAPSQSQTQQMMSPTQMFPMQMQYAPHPRSFGYGHPPPIHMMPPPSMQMRMHSPPPPSKGPSVEEFPPLGATGAPGKESATVEQETKTVSNASSIMVPTAIKSKPRK